LNEIKYRNSQVSGKINSVLDSLQSIEVSVTNNCNRRCSFCPNKKLDQTQHMTVDTAHKIASHLNDFKYKKRLGISGFGEPMTNPDILKIILMMKYIKFDTYEIVTNGDFLTSEIIKMCHENGINRFLISLYDGPQQIQKFIDMFNKAGVSLEHLHLRHRYKMNEQNFNNRAGFLYEMKNEGPCYLPFYKLMINWNGDYHVCSNDWAGETAEFNVHNMSIEKYWISEQMERYRLELLRGKRSLLPCNKCDCKGTLVGNKQFKYFERHYEKTKMG